MTLQFRSSILSLAFIFQFGLHATLKAEAPAEYMTHQADSSPAPVAPGSVVGRTVDSTPPTSSKPQGIPPGQISVLSYGSLAAADGKPAEELKSLLLDPNSPVEIRVLKDDKDTVGSFKRVYITEDGKATIFDLSKKNEPNEGFTPIDENDSKFKGSIADLRRWVKAQGLADGDNRYAKFLKAPEEAKKAEEAKTKIAEEAKKETPAGKLVEKIKKTAGGVIQTVKTAAEKVTMTLAAQNAVLADNDVQAAVKQKQEELKEKTGPHKTKIAQADAYLDDDYTSQEDKTLAAAAKDAANAAITAAEADSRKAIAKLRTDAFTKHWASQEQQNQSRVALAAYENEQKANVSKNAKEITADVLGKLHDLKAVGHTLNNLAYPVVNEHEVEKILPQADEKAAKEAWRTNRSVAFNNSNGEVIQSTFKEIADGLEKYGNEKNDPRALEIAKRIREKALGDKADLKATYDRVSKLLTDNKEQTAPCLGCNPDFGDVDLNLMKFEVAEHTAPPTYDGKFLSYTAMVDGQRKRVTAQVGFGESGDLQVRDNASAPFKPITGPDAASLAAVESVVRNHFISGRGGSVPPELMARIRPMQAGVTSSAIAQNSAPTQQGGTQRVINTSSPPQRLQQVSQGVPPPPTNRPSENQMTVYMKDPATIPAGSSCYNCEIAKKTLAAQGFRVDLWNRSIMDKSGNKVGNVVFGLYNQKFGQIVRNQ